MPIIARGVSEARTRAVLDHAVDGIITMDEQGIVESFNPAAARIFGYRPDEVVGRELTMLMDGPQRAGHLRQLAEYLRTGVAKVIGTPREVTGRRKDGSDVPLDLAVSEMWIAGRRSFIGSLRDITERKRDEQLLRARARQHEVLAELGGLGLASGETASVFDEAVRLVAETLETPLSCIAELLPDGNTLRLAAGVGWQPGLVGVATVSTDGSPLLREWLAARQTIIVPRLDEVPIPNELLREHGVVSLVGVPIHDRGELLGLLEVFTTDHREFRADEVCFLEGVAALLGQAMQRRRVEAALRESEQRRQLIVEAANIGLWDWDIVRGTVYYSPQWKAQLGYADAELSSTLTQWEALLHPDDVEAGRRDLLAFLKSPTATYQKEFRLQHRDGSYRWIYSRAAALRDGRGRALRMLGAHVDITQRKQAEEHVLRVNAELEGHVAQRTAQLQAANRELEAFSYSVSHDLRAPLRAIDGFAQALAEDFGGTLPERGVHYLDRVRSGTQRMGDLIDDLLALARVTRIELREEVVDLSVLAQTVAAELRQAEPDRAVTFVIEPGLVVRGDAALLRLVLENLLGNAWKYTSRQEGARIEFGAQLAAEERVYYVRDDGAGFDPRYADKLFGAFQRLHTAAEFEGTGIGLATVQRIVSRHGGRVWAEGAVGEGATFYFVL